MKRFFLAVVIMITAITVSGQATTQSEFTYIKVGYREVEEKGNDMKQGYSVEDLATETQYTNVILTVKLIRRDKDNSIAGFSVKTVVEGLLGSSVKYYCMPSVNLKTKTSYGWSQWYADISSMGSYEKEAVIKWLSYRVAYEISN